MFNKGVIAPRVRGTEHGRPADGTRVCVCVRMCDRADLIIIPSSVHIGQLLESRAPVVEVVIVLVPRAGGVEGADRAGGRAATLIVKHQQGVIRGSCGVVVCCSQALNRTERRKCID